LATGPLAGEAFGTDALGNAEAPASTAAPPTPWSSPRTPTPEQSAAKANSKGKPAHFSEGKNGFKANTESYRNRPASSPGIHGKGLRE
jgi:hypothetical protein